MKIKEDLEGQTKGYFQKYREIKGRKQSIA
jgi:hypothetical protein